MTSRELVLRTLNHQPVDRAPRDLWYLPGVETLRADEVAEIEVRYPRDVVPPDFKYPPGKQTKGKPYRVGQYTDAWGCTWQVTRRDTIGELKDFPLADAAKIAAYQPALRRQACPGRAGQGESKLCGDQPVRAGLDRNPAL